MCLIINGNLQKANIHLKVYTMGTCFDRKPFTSLTYLAFRKNTCESFRKKSSVPQKELRFSLVFVLKLPVRSFNFSTCICNLTSHIIFKFYIIYQQCYREGSIYFIILATFWQFYCPVFRLLILFFCQNGYEYFN